MQNPSILLYGPGQAKLEDRAIPDIEDEHQVIVRIAYVGVCGSDVSSFDAVHALTDSPAQVHFWKHGGIGTKVNAEQPLVMGHEASGTVHAVGSAVSSVKKGDRVAIEPGTPCRRCRACKNGKYNLCLDMQFAAAPPTSHGMLTKYYRIAEDFVYRIPDSLSLQEAVLVEPLAVAVHAVREVDVKPGQSVVIMGSGTIGLLCAAVAEVFGARQTILVDVVQQKLQFARDFIGCDIFLSKIGQPAQETAEQIIHNFDLGAGCDVVIEASGAESCMQTGIHLLRLGGNYIQTGIGKPYMEVPMLMLSEKELKVHGCFRYGSGDYELAVGLLAKGAIKVKTLISSVTPFERATEAWDKTARGEGVKNMIQGCLD